MALSIEEQREKYRETKKALIIIENERRLARNSELAKIYDESDIIKIKVNSVFGLPGIYFLRTNNEIVYIGESNCVISRINEHINENTVSW